MTRLAAGVTYIGMFQAMSGFFFTDEYLISPEFEVRIYIFKKNFF